MARSKILPDAVALSRAPEIRVSQHAIERFQEWVANLPEEIVRALLDTPTINRAAEFGAPYVRLGSGHRIVLDHFTVVTILPPHCPYWRLGMRKPAGEVQ